MNEFELAIRSHLEKVASSDEVFREKYEAGLSDKKDIKACCNYICEEVRKTGRRGFADDEVYGMAVHFYDEESITPSGKSVGCTVVVNHEIKLSAEEVKKIREDARKEAEDKVRREEIARIENERKKAEEASKRKREQMKDEGQLFLFED